MGVTIKSGTLDPWRELQAYQEHAPAAGSFGATAVFVGTMRDFNAGDSVQGMRLEHYGGMAEKHLEQIIAETTRRWPVLDCLIVHRVGEVKPGDPIVLTAVWSAHRAAAFEACRHLMEELKTRAPFWKQETLEGGTQRWVERNTPA